MFADECQRLTDTNSTLAEIAQRLGNCTPLELDGNHRNTRQIAAFAARFHTGIGLPAAPDRDGPPPRVHRPPDRGAAALLVTLAQRHPDHTIGGTRIRRRGRGPLGPATEQDIRSPRITQPWQDPSP